MRATCWMGPKTVEVQQVPDPKILNQRDCIVKITSTAICGSDLHLYNGFTDEQVLFLSDIYPTGYMGAEMCDIRPGDVIAVWGCGPVGLFAMKSAFLLGASRVIAIDRFPYRLQMAREKVGAEVINYTEVNVLEALKEMTGGRGPDGCIDAVGMEAHKPGLMFAYDRVKQA